MNSLKISACAFTACAVLLQFADHAAAQVSKTLGLSPPELSAIYGKPRILHPASMPVYLYDTAGMKYERSLGAFSFSLPAPVPLADARRRAAQVMPTDARRVGQAKHGAQTVDIWRSAWLARATDKNPFYFYGNAKPGTFIAVYTPAWNAPGKVASFALYPGGGLD